MALEVNQQIQKLVIDSNHILIAFRKDYTIDGVASATALYLTLKKMNKMVDIVCSDFVPSKNIKFLVGIDSVKTDLSNLQKFVISLDTSKNELDEFSYNVEKDKLNIFITPKSGIFTKDDVDTSTSDYKYDLIFVLDSPDLESLGKVYDNHNDFFYNTSIVNIDHDPQNEHFGQINLTNLNATSVCEILYDLFNSLEEKHFDGEIATALLTGIVSKTKSFKTPNVTPKTLNISSELIALEADREKVVTNLYRARSITTLKLWGRVLARLHSNSELKLAWSLLNSHDFIESGAEEEDLPDVIDELISTMPGNEIVALIYQMEAGKICSIVQTLKDINALYLVKQFSPWGSKNQARFCIEGKNLPEVEKEIIEVIRKNLKQ
ncbi:hypothetical protein KKA15_04340 [Patescibacteria group bacterium]|nr:hypothetical protein [Patescibacteria group bacterium]